MKDKKTLLILNPTSETNRELIELARKYKDNLYILYLISNSTNFLRDPWIGDNISSQKDHALSMLDNVINWLEMNKERCCVKTGFEISVVRQMIKDLKINKIIAEPQQLCKIKFTIDTEAEKVKKKGEESKLNKVIKINRAKNIILKLAQKYRIHALF